MMQRRRHCEADGVDLIQNARDSPAAPARRVRRRPSRAAPRRRRRRRPVSTRQLRVLLRMETSEIADADDGRAQRRHFVAHELICGLSNAPVGRRSIAACVSPQPVAAVADANLNRQDARRESATRPMNADPTDASRSEGRSRQPAALRTDLRQRMAGGSACSCCRPDLCGRRALLGPYGADKGVGTLLRGLFPRPGRTLGSHLGPRVGTADDRHAVRAVFLGTRTPHERGCAPQTSAPRRAFRPGSR